MDTVLPYSDGRYNNLQRFTVSPLLCLGLLAEWRVDGLSLDVMCPFDRRLTMFRGQLVPFEVRQRLFPVADNVTGCVDLYAYVD